MNSKIWSAAAYDRIFSPIYNITTNLTGWQEDITKSALEGVKPCKMLDVGCGTGFVLSEAKRQGFEVQGVDYSEGMLTKAKEGTNLEESELSVGSAEELKFADDTFDFVLASGVLVHLKDPSKAIAEMLRVLRADGLARIIDHRRPKDPNPLYRIIEESRCKALGYHLHDYPTLAKTAGAKVLSLKEVGRHGYLQSCDFTNS
ncbi:hypothetical protein BVY02_01760 [bacterium J17]|nr:hypothetical protein BVY02_01760 [bacterium J17]